MIQKPALPTLNRAMSSPFSTPTVSATSNSSFNRLSVDRLSADKVQFGMTLVGFNEIEEISLMRDGESITPEELTEKINRLFTGEDTEPVTILFQLQNRYGSVGNVTFTFTPEITPEDGERRLRLDTKNNSSSAVVGIRREGTGISYVYHDMDENTTTYLVPGKKVFIRIYDSMSKIGSNLYAGAFQVSGPISDRRFLRSHA